MENKKKEQLLRLLFIGLKIKLKNSYINSVMYEKRSAYSISI